MAGIRGVRAGRIELDGREAERDVMRGAFGGEIGIVVVVLAARVLRIEIRVRTQTLVHAAAEQFVHRLVRRLADDVPARHFQAADHAHHREIGALREAARIRLAIEALDMMRIVAEQIAFEHVLDDRRHRFRMERRGVDLADALDAAIGTQLDEDPVHAAHMRRRHGDDMRFQRGDFHC